MYDDERYVTRAAKAGAMGYLLKDSVEDDLLRAIKVIHSGQSFFSPQIARVVLNGYAHELRSKQVEDRYDLLTQRERQVYQMLAEGRSNKDIAEVLGLSLHTVETHRIHIMEKMDVHSSAELVLSAVRRGIIS
jgi:DNA-binding NarL/FixJ family response regulator